MKRGASRTTWALVKLALADILHSRREILAGWAVLSLGLTALLVSFGFRESIQDYIDQNARRALTADVRVTRTTAFPPELLEAVENTLDWQESRREIEFLANIRPLAPEAENSLLVSVHAVEANFPALGQIELESSKDFSQLIEEGTVLVSPEVRDLLNLTPGDRLALGQIELSVGDSIRSDPALVGFGTGFAPRIYIPFDRALESGLIQFGSQSQFHHYYTLKNPALVGASVEGLTDLQRPEGATALSFSIRSADRALANIERGLGFFQSLLALLSLTVAAFAFMIGFYLVQIFSQSRAQHWAVYLIFGARRAQVQWLGWLQSALLLLFSWLSALVIVFLLFAWLREAGGALFPLDFQLYLGPQSLISSALVSLIAASLFYLPTALRLARLQAKSLLEQDSPELPELKPWSKIWPYLLSSLCFFILTTHLFHNLWLALAFAGILILNALVALSLVPRFFSWLSQRTISKPRWTLSRLAFLSLSRARFVTTLCFMALLKAGFILGFIPHLYENAIVKELATPDPSQLPNYFVINIAENDTETLKDFLASHTAELRYLSPFILARLVSINNEPSDLDLFRRFPTRVSYRGELIDSEKVIRGPELPPVHDPKTHPIPLISVETQYARRSGMKIGDLLEFEVAGFPVQGLIANLRQVSWNSFQPNFFIQFQKGVLEDFPKTYIGVVYESPSSEVNLAYLIHQNFPNLSLINVSQTISRLAEVTRSLGPPLRTLSLSTVGSAFVLVLALIFHNLLQRRSERALFSQLGANSHKITHVYQWEYLSLGGLAGALGIFSGTLTSFWVGHRLLEAQFSWIPSAWGAGVTLILLVFVWLVVAASTTQKGN